MFEQNPFQCAHENKYEVFEENRFDVQVKIITKHHNSRSFEEIASEKRVALLPEAIASFSGLKVDVLVENSAGECAWSEDAKYLENGAKIGERSEIIATSGLILMINPPDSGDISLFNEGKVLVGTFNPLSNISFVEDFRKRNLTVFSLDAIPQFSFSLFPSPPPSQ